MNINKIDFKSFLNFEDKFQEEKKVEPEVNFGQILGDAMNKVNDLQLESQHYKELLAVGELENLHDLTIASEKANVALQATMSIRTKIVEAYKEIMRIQI